jgi:hypothetical protein
MILSKSIHSATPLESYIFSAILWLVLLFYYIY